MHPFLPLDPNDSMLKESIATRAAGHVTYVSLLLRGPHFSFDTLLTTIRVLDPGEINGSFRGER